MKFCFDIDGTLCTDTKGVYRKAIPFDSRILSVNKLFDQGHTIILFTARGTTLGINAVCELTKTQLKMWGVKYHKLLFGKPEADAFIDDKGIRADEYFKR